MRGIVAKEKTTYPGLTAILVTEIISLGAILVSWGPLATVLAGGGGIAIGFLTYKTTGCVIFVVCVLVMIAIPIAGIVALLLTARWLFAWLLITVSVATIATCLYDMVND